MPMPSQASGAVARSFAIGKAMRRQVSSPAHPRLAEPQRSVNSHIHATNGPHTRPPPRPQPLEARTGVRLLAFNHPERTNRPPLARVAASRTLGRLTAAFGVCAPSFTACACRCPAISFSFSSAGSRDLLAFSNSVSTADFRFNASRSAALGPDFKAPFPDRPAFNDNGSDGCRPFVVSCIFTSFDFRSAGGFSARPSTNSSTTHLALLVPAAAK